MLSLQGSLDPEDEVEIVMDRRCPRGVSEAESRGPVRQSPDRRRNTCVDLEVPVDNHEQADDGLDRKDDRKDEGDETLLSSFR